MVDEGVAVDGSTNNGEGDHSFEGMCDDAREALPLDVGGDVCILSFLDPPVPADALVGEAVFVAEEEL